MKWGIFTLPSTFISILKNDFSFPETKIADIYKEKNNDY